MSEDKAILKREATERIIAEMSADERYSKYFENYTEISFASFIKICGCQGYPEGEWGFH